MSRFITATLLAMALTVLCGCSRRPEGEGDADGSTPHRSEGRATNPDEATEADSRGTEHTESEQAGDPAEAKNAGAIVPPRLMGEENGPSGTEARPSVREPSEPPRSGDPADLELGEGEVSLGTARVGRMKVGLVQRPGLIAGGQEAHLLVTLPDSDGGEVIVRAWLGTMDRAKWEIATGEYLPASDRYDIRVTTSDSVPSGAMWWIEIETPDGRKAIGAAEPARE